MGGEAALGRAMMELVRRCSQMSEAEAADEVGRFLEGFDDEFVDDPYESHPDDDPVKALQRKLFIPVRHGLEYKEGPLPTPTPAVAAVYEQYNNRTMRSVGGKVGLRVSEGGNGHAFKAMPKAEYEAGRRRKLAVAAKRRAARAGMIPKKKTSKKRG